MNSLFESYKSLQNDYFNHLKNNNQVISRALRTFDIRFRLALDLEIEYSGNVSYVKTKHVKDTYKKTLRLMDLWNSYEALLKYVKNELKHSLVKSGPDKDKKSEYWTTAENYYKKTTALETLKSVAENLKKKANDNDKFKNDFRIYIERIANDKSKSIESHIKKQVSSILDFIDGKIEISGIEILSLIYAERNMYFHDGEPGKMGISYPNRIYLLSAYYNCLEEVILKSIIYVLSSHLKQVK